MADVCITAVAATTSVGLKAVQTAASVRAGISRLLEHAEYYCAIDPPYLDDPQLLTCAPVALIDDLMSPAERLLTLGLYPLQELLEGAKLTRADLTETGLFLASSPPAEGISEWGMEDDFIPELTRRAGLSPFLVALLDRRGYTAFYHLLHKAITVLAEGRCPRVVLGGVDSWLDAESIEHYDEAYRLKSSRNRDGFIPGEGAGYLLLETEAGAKRRKADVLCTVSSPALEVEENPFTGDANSTGRGLTAAIRAQIRNVGGAPDWIACDQNGERYRAFEWGVAYTRLAQELSGLRGLWHPADSFGDIRSASSPVHVVLAAEAFRQGYAPGPRCLVYAGSDEGERGAVMVTAPGGGR